MQRRERGGEREREREREKVQRKCPSNIVNDRVNFIIYIITKALSYKVLIGHNAGHSAARGDKPG